MKKYFKCLLFKLKTFNKIEGDLLRIHMPESFGMLCVWTFCDKNYLNYIKKIEKTLKTKTLKTTTHSIILFSKCRPGAGSIV